MTERIFPGGPLYSHEDGVFKPGTDSLLLGDFAGLGGVATLCDLGCGGGIISLSLLARRPAMCVTAVDISPKAAALARQNFELNSLSVRVLQADLRDHRSVFLPGSFDAAVSNPPYFVPSRGGRASVRPAAARSEETLSLAELCACAAFILKNGGRFSLVYHPERLSELFCSMTASGIEPKRLRLCAASAGAVPSVALVEGRKGGAPGLSVEKLHLIGG